MKPIVRRGLGLLLVLACAAVWLLTSSAALRQRRGRTCQGKGTLDVTVTDSLERRFVARADIEQWLEAEYRAYAGLPLDSVDLRRIERIVLGHSAVRDCQAWLTDDGILHVQLSQRQPVLRLESGGNACYTDESGFLFPLQSRGGADVPVVDGRLPLTLQRGYKGEPAEEAERVWLQEMIGLVRQMQGTVWEHIIRHITVDAKGNLVLLPVQGKEQFLFGSPTRVSEKLGLMAAYYEGVVPSKEAGWYRTVDVRYRGQIVCRK